MSSTRVARQVRAPRSAVYRALIDPASVAEWRVPDGMTSEVHEFDARVGGRFRISLTYDDPSAAGKSGRHTDTYQGHFDALVPDETVVEAIEFESADPGMRGEMTMTTSLSDVGDGTEVVMLHEGLPDALSPDANEAGTRMALDKLARLVERG